MELQLALPATILLVFEILLLFVPVILSSENRPSFPGVGTEVIDTARDDRAAELYSLMDVLDTHYTPQCLRVVFSTDERNAYSNSSTLKEPHNAHGYRLSLPSISHGNIGNDKPSIILTTEFMKVKNALGYITKNIGKVTSYSCVSYMLSEPPDSKLMSLFLDPHSKRLTGYFYVYTQSSTEAEQFLLDQRLGKEENVAALVQEESQNKSYWRVLIRHLLHPSGSPQVLTVNRWSRDTGLTSTENIFPEQMANFYGQKLTGVALPYLPFGYFQQFEGSLALKYRPCVNVLIIGAIAKNLNFSFEMVMPADRQWGYLKDDGHFGGIIGELEFNRGHFAFDLSVTLERTLAVDFTDYYFVDAITFVAVKSRPDPLWQKLITPFASTVWLCVLVSVGGGSLLYHVIYHAQATLTSSSLLSSNAFMDVLASFLSQSLHSYLSLQAGKVFLGFWLVYAFLVTSYYKTSLTSTLAVPFKPPTLDSLQELLQSGLPYGMHYNKGSAYSLFAHSTVPLYQDMFQNMLFDTTPKTLQSAKDGRLAYIKFKSHLDLVAAIHNNDPERETDLHVAPNVFFTSGNGCAVPKGAPHRRTFNAVLTRLVEAGLIRKWYRDALPVFVKQAQKKEEATTQPSQQRKTNNNNEKSQSREVAFSLDHFQGPFFMWFLGSAGGGLLCLGEVLLWRLGGQVFHTN